MKEQRKQLIWKKIIKVVPLTDDNMVDTVLLSEQVIPSLISKLS